MCLKNANLKHFLSPSIPVSFGLKNLVTGIPFLISRCLVLRSSLGVSILMKRINHPAFFTYQRLVADSPRRGTSQAVLSPLEAWHTQEQHLASDRNRYYYTWKQMWLFDLNHWLKNVHLQFDGIHFLTFVSSSTLGSHDMSSLGSHDVSSLGSHDISVVSSGCENLLTVANVHYS